MTFGNRIRRKDLQARPAARFALPAAPPAAAATHQCAAEGCAVMVRTEFLMCGSHWRLVPAAIQREVLRAWHAYQRSIVNSIELSKGRDRPVPTIDFREAHMQAKDAAIAAVKEAR